MEDRCYLLSVGELLGEGSETLRKEAWGRVDGARREKAKRLQPGPAQAASLGAGLLLQLAVRDFTARDNSAAERENIERESSAERSARENTEAKRSEKEKLPGEKSGSGKQERGLLCGLYEYTVSRLLGSLSTTLELRMDYGEKGKPYLRDYPFYFNLSHSMDYVICAVSDREVGADIQWCSMEKGERLERIARRFFSPEELAALACCREQVERAQLFYRLWTRKEAYGKLTGGGIGAALDKNFLPSGSEGETDGESVLWQEWQYPAGYRIALCARGRRDAESEEQEQRTERPGI